MFKNIRVQTAILKDRLISESLHNKVIFSLRVPKVTDKDLSYMYFLGISHGLWAIVCLVFLLLCYVYACDRDTESEQSFQLL